MNIVTRLRMAVTAIILSLPLPAAADFEELGDVLQIAVPTWAAGKEFFSTGTAYCIGGIAATSVATHALKEAVKQPRPAPYSHDLTGWPSGHTSAAASGFGCNLAREGWTPATSVMFLSTILVGLSRIDANKHTLGQVVAGLALGTFLGYQAGKRAPERSVKLYVGNNAAGTTVGISMVRAKVKVKTPKQPATVYDKSWSLSNDISGAKPPDRLDKAFVTLDNWGKTRIPGASLMQF